MVALDTAFYADHAFSADPADPVDRWCQLAHSGNRASVQALLGALGLGREGHILLDPFCGAGSTLLAGVRAGGIVAGCDIEPGAVAVSVLKLAAPDLADDLAAGRSAARLDWAREVAALADEVRDGGLPTDALLAEDCLALENRWATTGHGVTLCGAADSVEALDPVLTGRVVDVFTSPPHDTGRPSPWSTARGGHLLAGAPAPYLPATVGRTTSPASRGSALDELGVLLGTLAGRGRLGRVAIEFEDTADEAPAGVALAGRLTALGLRDVTLVPLYAGSPDGLSGVTGGGVVTATG